MKKSINIINGIGTDIGKTFITSRLIEKARSLSPSKNFCILKPVASGVSNVTESDTATLLKAAGIYINKENLNRATRYFLKSASSINIAAALENIDFRYEEIRDFCFQEINMARKQDKIIFIEMSGGLCSPITDSKTMLDLTLSINDNFTGSCDNILVTTDYLGSISHTILCCKAFTFDKIVWNPRNQDSSDIKKTIEKFIGKALYTL